MCNRFRLTAKQLELAERYGVDPATLMPDSERLPPPELFPKKASWVVRNGDGQLKLDVIEWGVPFNVKSPKTGKVTTKPVTNVRNLASGFWRNMLSNPANRCLVPVTEFAEPKGEVGSKVWRWFSLPNAPIFSFAGVVAADGLRSSLRLSHLRIQRRSVDAHRGTGSSQSLPRHPPPRG